MRRNSSLWKILAGAILVALVGGYGYTAYQKDALSRDIDGIVALAAARGEPADFARVDRFVWDTMYVFGPYTPPDTVEAALGFTWSDPDKVAIEQRDDINLVIFTRGRAVVDSLELERRKIDFDLAAGHQAFMPQSARFQVQMIDGATSKQLTPLTP